jgi:hypothetical protein
LVKKAIIDLRVEAKFRKFRYVRKKLGEDIEKTQIPFSFVEEALQRVAEKWRGPENGVEDLEKIAVEALLDVCERATGDKGPPGLPEVEQDSG